MSKNLLTKLLLAATLFCGATVVHADRFNEQARYAGFTALPAASQDDVVFIGNSITHMMNWWEAFGNRHNIHGRGNSGAKTYQALDNLESMIAGQPAKAFVMLGTNDFGDADNAQHVTHLVKTLLKRIRLESPATTVYCQSILPSGVGYRKGTVNEANELLKEWIAQENDPKLVYVDLYTLFDDGTGSIKNRGANQDFTLSYDDLHLTPIGYRMWMEKIKELTGYETVIPEGAKNLHAGQQTSWGARIATFGTMPVTADDILMFGDDFIHYGEWHELIGSTDFKDRGTGWQFFSSNISQVQAALEPGLAKSNYNTLNCGVQRTSPRAVCLSVGGRNIMDSESDTSIKSAYLALLNAARKQVDATTPIFLMSILPVDNTAKNTKIKTLNAYMKQLANEKDNVYYVDLYSAMSTGDVQTPKYFHADQEWTYSGITLHPYPTPLGYVKAANVLCESLNAQLGTHYTPISESEAQVNIDRFTARSIVGNAVTDLYNKLYNVGNGPGQFTATGIEGAEEKIAEACKVLWNTTITTEQANAAIAPFSTMTFTLNLPKASEGKDGPQYLYTISDVRSKKYLTATSGTTNLSTTATASGGSDQRWMLTPNAAGGYNLQNVLTKGYIVPTSGGGQVTMSTSTKEPSKGWNIEPVGTTGYFIIVSGTNQINHNNGNAIVYNWGGGNNTTDLGCQFRFVLAEEISSELAFPAGSALNNLMPRPQQASLTAGTFTGRIADASVTVDASAVKTFDYTVAGFDNEGYTLSVTPTGIVIKAASNVGVIRAKQTLRQLITEKAAYDFSDLAAIDAAEVTLECCEITDYPAFKVRGFMHDVGRSFISFEELKKEIDLLSRFKVNVFHWHLTDHHAFRFESKKRPKVNTKFERFPEGIYTQEQCRELDAYAAERGITIIPEIDMPGHSRQFKNATGYDMTSATGKAILKDVLGELAECFPHAPYIHVGADESGATVAYVKEMTDHVHSLGKKTVCWNTYGSGALVTPKTMGVDMLTNWATSGKKVDGVPNIDMRYFYVNHFDVFADLAGAYRSLILDAERGNANIGGVSIGIWNDRYISNERQIIAQNNVYATVIAMTERAWVGGEGHQYIERGGAYLPNEGRDHDEYCDWERRFLYYKDKWLANEPIPYVKSTNVIWNITPPYNNNGNVNATFDPETPGAELTPQPGSTFATGAGQWLNHIWNSIVTGVIGSQGYDQTRYAWTYVYSPVDQKVGAQIEFRNYSRSDRGLVPQNKKWDIMGSRVWVNDKEILPAWNWTNANTNPDIEAELGNLNFPGRAPIKVELKAGWNKVLLKCPYINIGGGNGNRPNKWQYTFVFTDLEGKHAVDGLIYSPNRLMEGEDFSIPPIIGKPVTYTVDKNGGSLSSSVSNSSWNNRWTSTDGFLTFTASANNMAWSGSTVNIDARSGSSAAKRSDYTLAAIDGYVINSYSFTASAISNNQTWSTDGKSYTATKTKPVTVSASDINVPFVAFVLSGENTGSVLTEFTVVVQPVNYTPDEPVIDGIVPQPMTSSLLPTPSYDLQGRRVASSSKGIVISGGKIIVR